MKKKILVLLGIISLSSISAQVGINTKTPKGIFHIDPQGDTSGIANITDDILVDSDGNMGIGTIAPSAKLHIVSNTVGKGFRLEDTTQGKGKVLTSDANGYGQWKTPGLLYTTLGNIPSAAVSNQVLSSATDATHIAYSGMSITLEPGDHQVNFTVWAVPIGNPVLGSFNGARFCSVFFSTSATSNIPPTYLSPIKSVIIPRLYNIGAQMPDYYGSGAIPIRITTKSTIYVWIYMHSSNWNGATRWITSNNQAAGSYGPYSQLFAIPFYTK